MVYTMTFHLQVLLRLVRKESCFERGIVVITNKLIVIIVLYHFHIMAVNFFVAVTLDLKCLYLFLEKLHDENFVLAGRGIEIEFCFLCHALRVCAVTHHFFYYHLLLEGTKLLTNLLTIL